MQLEATLSGYLWRPLTASEEDTGFILSMRNMPVAREAFFSGRITREDHLRFVQLAEERDEINWIIENNGERVGASGIYKIDRNNRRAEVGRFVAVDPELHILNYVVAAYVVFEHLGLNKVVGEALAANRVSNRQLERLGIVLEGTFREHVFKDGVAHDLAMYGTLASDWRRMRSAVYAQFGEPRLVRHVHEYL